MIAVGLSMDAFAVAIAKGLSMKRVRVRDAALVGAWFGLFQFLMPLIGALLGTRFLQQIEVVDHWVAFGILAVVGGKMFREAFTEGKQAVKSSEEDIRTGKTEEVRDTESGEGTARQATQVDLRFPTMLWLAIATSIDALAVGITFGLLPVRIVPAAACIGCVTFGISFGGVFAGRFLGAKVQKGATLAGGAVLICIGLKILLEHLGMLPYR